VAKRIPLVDYLHLEPEPHLVAHEYDACSAELQVFTTILAKDPKGKNAWPGM
jgi:hypothetical protein